MTRRIESSFMHTRRYEDPALQQKIRSIVPVAELEKRAKMDDSAPSHYDSRDRLLLQVLHWFKSTFFKWVNQPPCSVCAKDEAGNMTSVGGTQPTPEEMKWEAFMVEVYSCKSCNSITRFPRYNHRSYTKASFFGFIHFLNFSALNAADKLLQTRCGRCGEWANCFTAVCRALGFEARHVVDWTDHVWTEVYSSSQQRWMHCDSCEDKLDAPLMYETGWGKKLSYVLAFSAFEVVDVSKRYTRKWQEVLDRRTLVSEEWLEKKLDFMNQMILSSLPPQIWDPMLHRKGAEKKELEETLDETSEEAEAAAKAAEQEGRISGSKEWKDARGESGKPKTDASESCAVPGSPGAHIPVVSYQLADKTNFDAVLGKIKEFNASPSIPDKARISESDISLLDALVKTLRTESATAKVGAEQIAVLERAITSWPFPNLFPVLDIARVSLLNTSAAEIWSSKMAALAMRFLIFASAAAASAATPEIASANTMMILRFFSNSLAFTSSRSAVGKFSAQVRRTTSYLVPSTGFHLYSCLQIADLAISAATRCTKNAKQAAAFSLVKYALFMHALGDQMDNHSFISYFSVSKALVDLKDEKAASTVAASLLRAFKATNVTADDSELLYCIIVGAGTLASAFPAVGAALATEANYLQTAISDVKALGVQKLSDSIDELRVCLKIA